MISTQIERDYAITPAVALAIAEQIARSQASRGKNVPAGVDLAEMITGVGQSLTMQGAPQLQINLLDPEFVLLNSGFWGVGAGGRLDEIQINYPQGSKYWWRVRQVSPKADFSCETYWIPRVVRELMDLHGPVKASRGSRTRAEFLKMLCGRVPEIRFHSRQLDVVQPIANIKLPESHAADTGAKAVGLTSKSAKGLTVKGQPMTSQQRDVAGTLLQVADKKHAGSVPTEALIYAGIWESGLTPSNGNGSYWGVLSGKVDEWQQNDTVGMAEAFLAGGKGFTSAIQLAQKTSNPIQVAVEAEKPSIWPENAYAKESGYPGDEQALNEVKAIIEAGGGSTGTGGIEAGTMETVQQYNFEIGTTEEPHEDFWTGMNRLAQEVNWELVVDGPDIYYDSDITLCRAALADVIERTDENVADWEYDWDTNHIATNFMLVLTCDEFEYRGGDAVKVVGFGPATEGSTLANAQHDGLPGRWLIGEVQRNPGDIVATLTLVQPTRPLKEPAPTVSSSTSSGLGGSPVLGDFAPQAVLAAVQAAQRLSSMSLPYSQAYRILTQKPPAGGYDCSAGVSWVLLTAGFPLPGGVGWNQWAPVSGDFEKWGEPGPGKEMTVWCDGDHVFIEFNVPNVGHVGFDSGHPSSEAAWFGPFRDQNYVTSGVFVPRHWKGT